MQRVVSADPVAERVLGAVAAECEARGNPVLALWLFGSRACGTARDDSDVDVGALFDEAPGAELWSIQDAVALREGVDVDLVDLGAATPELAWEVITGGRLQLETNERAVEQFVRRARFAAEDSERRNRMVVLAQLPLADRSTEPA